MSNKPEIALKMEEIEERGYLNTANILTELKDFNEIPKENGIYMISTRTNSPLNVDYDVWYFCRVTVHNQDYLTQEAWLFATETTTMWIRTFHNGTWYEWGQVAKIYDIEDRAMTPKEPQTYGNDFNSYLKMGVYHIINCQKMLNKPPTIENVGLLTVFSGTVDNSYAKVQIFSTFNNTGLYYRTRGYGSNEWFKWVKLATTDQRYIASDASQEFREKPTLPIDYLNGFFTTCLKKSSSIGIPSRHLYSHVLGINEWSDTSANSHELIFSGNQMFFRTSENAETWKEPFELSITKKEELQLLNGFEVVDVGRDELTVSKSGNICTINGRIVNKTTAPNGLTVAILPEAYRPTKYRRGYGIIEDINKQWKIEVKPTGELSVYDGYSKTNEAVRINMSYVL